MNDCQSRHSDRPKARSGSASAGDEFRAKLLDLDWVRSAGPAELRAAVHALCWRANRATIDGLCTDAGVAEKVLITASGVAAELDSRIDTVAASIAENPEPTTLADLQRERTALLRRKSSAETLTAACDAAVQFDRLSSAHRSVPASELAAAIAEHRRRVRPCGATEADNDLWRVLDGASTNTTRQHRSELQFSS
ncbi:hypothetical protein [Mycolicibacterium sp.]|uniref:hypothetical protein n=1 Tax=Mycolicibacterium sp. TaxID=2320850 RepID=UPI00355D5732